MRCLLQYPNSQPSTLQRASNLRWRNGQPPGAPRFQYARLSRHGVNAANPRTVPIAIGPAATSSFDRAGSTDLLLQEHDPVEQRLGSGRTAWHVDVDRDDPIAAACHRIRVMIIAAAVGAGSHRDHVTGLGHLIADLAPCR